MNEQWSFELIKTRYLRGLDYTTFGFWFIKMNKGRNKLEFNIK